MSPDPIQTAQLVSWNPTIGPSDIILLFAALVALFGERMWGRLDTRTRRRQLREVLVHSLENLKSDLNRIRNDRNQPAAENSHIEFDETSISEVSHYFDLFQNLVLPNLEAIRLPRGSRTIEFFDHYKKNVETANSKGYLTCATVDRLLERIDEAIDELS